MSESRHTLSIVMTNYNHGRFLEESLGAILVQSYSPIEVLVVDDGSTDDSVAVIEGLAKRHPLLRLIRNEKNIGVLPSITRLLGEARGTHISFQSADDIVLPGLFEKAMRQFDAHPGAAFCSALSAVIHESGKRLRVIPGPLLGKDAVFFTREEFVAKLESHGCWIMGNTTISNREHLIEAGGFRPELASFCDAFLYAVLGAKHGACFIPEVLSELRQMPNSYSASTNSDIERSLQTVGHVTALLDGEFKSLFPAGFPARFRDRLLDAAGWSFLAATVTQQRKGLEKLFAFIGVRHGLTHRAFLVSTSIQLAFWRLVLLVWFRRSESWSRISQRFETLYRGES